MNRTDSAAGLWTRRDLLRCTLAAAAGSSTLRGALGVLGGLGASAAVAAPDDYRALVCLYLRGGNDGYNWLVPTDNRYSTYATRRGALALEQASLLSLNPGTDGGAYGLHPSCGALQALYNQGRAAFVANVGTLLAPTTKADYLAQRNLPSQLFSHYDQTRQVSSMSPDMVPAVGWAGRLAELMAASNSNTQLPMNITLGGSNTLQTGSTVTPYAMKSSGVARFSVLRSSAGLRAATYQALLDQSAGGWLFNRQLQAVTQNAIDLSNLIYPALQTAPSFTTLFPDTAFAADLMMVAKMIGIQQSLGVKRQTFFVSLGSFDTHDDQLEDQAALLQQLSDGVGAFYGALDEINMGSSVTAFTLSDFGRTLAPNNDGTDHGWGNVHMVCGGAVSGGRVYGTFPDCAADSADDAEAGRMIPSTSIEQYAATLAQWFGADSTALATVFPHLSRFAPATLGFVG